MNIIFPIENGFKISKSPNSRIMADSVINVDGTIALGITKFAAIQLDIGTPNL